MNETPPDEATTSPFSARIEPFWLNPATIKGTIGIVAGAVILAFPDASIFVIRIVLGLTLIASGLSDVWFRVVRGSRQHRLRHVLEALLAIVGGVVFLIYPTETVRLLTVIAGVYFAVRGANTIVGALGRRGRSPWISEFTRGAFRVVFGLVLLLLPEAIVSGLIVVIATAAVVFGAIVLAFGVRHHSKDELTDVDAASVMEIVQDWMLLQDVGDKRREDIDDGLYFEQPERTNKLVAWWVMLLLSVAIATFGILANSTAVVIGAMLIAPLMTPIIGAAAATATGRSARMFASLAMVGAGVAAAVGLAFVIGAWAPTIVPLDRNGQVLSRVSPNVIDMAIALAAGAAGAFASVNKRVSSSIAGVAIAVALVPPLGVAGLTLQAGMYVDSLGASLLFLTNLVSIVLAAVVVFFLTGFAPIARAKERASEIKGMVATVAVVAMVISVPLIFTAEGILATASRQSTAQKEASEWLKNESGLHVIGVKTKGAEVNVTVAGSGDLPPIKDLGDALAEGFEEPITLIVEFAPTVVEEYSSPG